MTGDLPRRRVAFQGERGAFSEEAAIRLLGPALELVPCRTFEALFASVGQGLADYVLAPIENSLAGSVHRSYDLLLESPFTITGEVTIPIAHHLIGCPGASLETVRVVESHPVALAQCERFFESFPQLRRVATDDTAGSVRSVLEQGDLNKAAIAGARAAEVYGGKILREHLEDHRENYTRFILLSQAGEAPAGADKLSLVMRLAHRPSTLFHALEPFAERGVDLLKIESRPVKGEPWQYRFYLDLRASLESPEVAQAIEELKERAEEVRVLGCYPAASKPVN